MTEIAKEEARVSGGQVHTFLIADVRGYTRYTVEYGDEAAAELAAHFAAITRETVSAHEGEVIELRGDEALAVFSSARQALRAAVALQERFAGETTAATSHPLMVGIGLDAGEAVPVEGGYRGGALNLAARLCSLAGPGEVLLSEGVSHLARRLPGLRYAERGAVQLKGFGEPVRVVQLVAEEAEQPGPGNTTMETSRERPLPIGGFLGALPEGPLVARAEELSKILSAVDTVTGGSGRLVLLAGEPGVGKTRVAQEVTLAVRNRGFVMAAGRCYEPQQTVPYYPLLEALAAAYGAAPPTVQADAPRRWPYLARLLPDQLGPPPATSSDQEEQQRLFRAVTGFLQAIAETTPVALLLDDLHWADSASLELLQHLARNTRADRVLLLGTYRDVEVGRQHPLERALLDLHREGLVQEVPIRRLGQEGTASLIGATFGETEISAEFAELIHRHTEGNPFFTREVLQALVERGDIYRENGRWERREIEELSVPKSVRSALGERLSRLGEEAQEILREGSVLGPTFRFDDLQAMGDRGEEEVERALEEAEAAGLVRATGNDDYTFNHALTQQALYEELSPRRRRRLHLAAGAALEKPPERTREQRAAELALHFLSGDDPERALPYVLQAGDQAEAVFAHVETERQYRMALQLADELEDRAREAEAQEKLGRVLVLTARLDEALEVLERAVALYRAQSDREGEARATIEIADALNGKGRIGEAVTRLERMLESFEGAGASPAHARLYSWLAHQLLNTGRYEDMLTAADRAAELAGAVGDERILAEAKLWRGTALGNRGRIDDSREVLEEAVELMERLGALQELRFAVNNLGWAYLLLGEFERRTRCCERALAIAEQVGEPLQIAFSFANLSEIMFYLGDWPAARDHAERAAGISEGFGRAWYAAYPPLLLGIVDVAEGRWDDGDMHMAACLAVAQEHEDLQALRDAHQWLAEGDLLQGRAEEALARLQPLLDRPGLEEEQVTRLLASLASAYLELGEVDRAEETVMKGLERASRQSNQLALVDLLRVQGVLRSRQDRWEEAEQAFQEAVSLARSMSYPYAEARALYEWGRMHGVEGGPVLARERLEEALEIFRRLGARPYIEWTEQALAVSR